MRKPVVARVVIIVICAMIYMRRALSLFNIEPPSLYLPQSIPLSDYLPEMSSSSGVDAHSHVKRTQYSTDGLNAGQLDKRNQIAMDGQHPKWKEVNTTTCSLWTMPDRPPEWPQPRIFYGITFGYELEILLVLLHEIYPAVDYVIIVESTVTYTGLKKELNFEKNKRMFQPYLDKIRHVVMTQEDCYKLECHPSLPYEPWSHEHSQRKSIVRGLYDAEPDDLVIVADTDEVLSREYLFALKRCMYFPSLYNRPLSQMELTLSENPKVRFEPRVPDMSRCQRLSCWMVSFQHYFDCTNTGFHWHPDIAPAYCVQNWTTERLRMWDERSDLPYKLNDKYKTELLQFAVGWHMRSFLGVKQHSYKFKAYSETPHARISLDQIQTAKRECWAAEAETEEDKKRQRDTWFKFDSLGLAHLPHVIRDSGWDNIAHFVQYEGDDHEHDGFEAHQHNITN